MESLRDEFVFAAYKRVSMPFRHHFRPVNLCERGQTTVDACMERGLEPTGYDCSGLVVASLCDVLGLETTDWPRDYRHVMQLEVLATEDEPNRGDVQIYYGDRREDGWQRTHIGVFIADKLAIHASGPMGAVVEGTVQDYEYSQTIPFESMVKVAEL